MKKADKFTPPNWRDENEYLKPWNPIVYDNDKIMSDKIPKPPKDYRLAWEFLRRNPNYQNDIRHKETLEKKDLKSEARILMHEISKKYFINEWVAFPRPEDNFPINLRHVFNKTMPRVLSGLEVEQLEKCKEYCVPGTRRADLGAQGIKFVPRKPSEFIIMVDLTLPLKPQLSAAEKIISRQAEGLQNSDIQKLNNINIPQRHPFSIPDEKILLRYLRILDAKTSHAKTNEIAELLFERGDISDNERRVRADYVIAKEWRDSKYINITKRNNNKADKSKK